jgi:hypothetical protein
MDAASAAIVSRFPKRIKFVPITPSPELFVRHRRPFTPEQNVVEPVTYPLDELSCENPKQTVSRLSAIVDLRKADAAAPGRD